MTVASLQRRPALMRSAGTGRLRPASAGRENGLSSVSGANKRAGSRSVGRRCAGVAMNSEAAFAPAPSRLV